MPDRQNLVRLMLEELRKNPHALNLWNALQKQGMPANSESATAVGSQSIDRQSYVSLLGVLSMLLFADLQRVSTVGVIASFIADAVAEDQAALKASERIDQKKFTIYLQGWATFYIQMNEKTQKQLLERMLKDFPGAADESTQLGALFSQLRFQFLRRYLLDEIARVLGLFEDQFLEFQLGGRALVISGMQVQQQSLPNFAVNVVANVGQGEKFVSAAVKVHVSRGASHDGLPSVIVQCEEADHSKEHAVLAAAVLIHLLVAGVKPEHSRGLASAHVGVEVPHESRPHFFGAVKAIIAAHHFGLRSSVEALFSQAGEQDNVAPDALLLFKRPHVGSLKAQHANEDEARATSGPSPFHLTPRPPGT